jgi:hypothetical protein
MAFYNQAFRFYSPSMDSPMVINSFQSWMPTYSTSPTSVYNTKRFLDDDFTRTSPLSLSPQSAESPPLYQITPSYNYTKDVKYNNASNAETKPFVFKDKITSLLPNSLSPSTSPTKSTGKITSLLDLDLNDEEETEDYFYSTFEQNIFGDNLLINFVNPFLEDLKKIPALDPLPGQTEIQVVVSLFKKYAKQHKKETKQLMEHLNVKKLIIPYIELVGAFLIPVNWIYIFF